MHEYVRVREREAERKMVERSHLLARVSDALLNMTKAVMHVVIRYLIYVYMLSQRRTAHEGRGARGKKSGGRTQHPSTLSLYEHNARARAHTHTHTRARTHTHTHR